jgi:hypothetical protein
VTDINNDRVFDLDDRDPELIAQAMAEAFEQLTKHFQKVGVAGQVVQEVNRQEALWGEQNHPLHPGDGEGYRLQHAYQATHYQSLNSYRATRGQLAWDGILLEEVFEALTEVDPEKREVELTQVAAVAVSMILASRRERGVK